MNHEYINPVGDSADLGDIDRYNRVLAKIEALEGIADKENRDYTASEKAEVLKLDAKASDIYKEMQDTPVKSRAGSRIQLLGDSRATNPVSNRIVAKGESFAAKVSNSRGPQGVSLGGLMHGMLGGKTSSAVRASLTEGTDSQGGFTVPERLLAEFIDSLRQQSVVFNAGARALALDAQSTNIARLDTDPTWTWRAEEAAVTESTPSFSSINLVPKSVAVLIKASHEVLQDSINIEEILFNALVNSAAIAVDNAVLTGSGSSNQPLGIINTVGIGNVDMGTDGAHMGSYDDIIEAYYEIARQNGGIPSAAIMHPRTYKDIAKLGESAGQPLLRPDLIRDLPFLATTGMPIDETKGSSSDASSVLVGDFSQVIVGIRQDFQLEVLRELYREKLQVGFIAHLRVDVAVTRPQHFCRIEGVTTP